MKSAPYFRKDHRQSPFAEHEFTFRPRPSLSNGGRQFVGFNPPISNKAMKAMRETIRSWNLKRRTTETIENLAEM